MQAFSEEWKEEMLCNSKPRPELSRHGAGPGTVPPALTASVMGPGVRPSCKLHTEKKGNQCSFPFPTEMEEWGHLLCARLHLPRYSPQLRGVDEVVL